MHTLEQLRAGQLAGATRLQLACGLTEFPREIFELADTLEILDLSGNALTALPDDLPRLTKLRILFCSNNDFTALPAMLGACTALTMIGFKANRIADVPASSLPPRLRWLILTDNAIAVLPDALGTCTQMQKLMLSGNRLTALPASLAACTQLELLRISANAFEALPPWLTTMPRLAWLACAGNPFCAAPAATGEAIDWRALRLGARLGEGASGVIYGAVHATLGDVAVKVFKGAVTSDGLPDSEMAACLHAGRHANLIPVLGPVRGHPDGAHGLVMALADPAFTVLAGPPSFDSCTRDVYAPAQRYALPMLRALAHGVAAAAAHLHERGIVHGDLYGHNILHDGDGRAVLSDFGAASLHAPGTALAGTLERLDVRAFGCLLDELLARCDGPAPAALAELAALAHACMQPDTAARPPFAAIAAQLALSGGAALDNPI